MLESIFLCSTYLSESSLKSAPIFFSCFRYLAFLLASQQHRCWWPKAGNDWWMLVTEIRCWWYFWMQVEFYFNVKHKCMWVNKMATTVNNILWFSPTNFVTSIRRQHRCNHLSTGYSDWCIRNFIHLFTQCCLIWSFLNAPLFSSRNFVKLTKIAHETPRYNLDKWMWF